VSIDSIATEFASFGLSWEGVVELFIVFIDETGAVDNVGADVMVLTVVVDEISDGDCTDGSDDDDDDDEWPSEIFTFIDGLSLCSILLLEMLLLPFLFELLLMVLS
jgi:hypothetical protein